MEQGVINPKKLFFPKDDSDDPIAVTPTFFGDEYFDSSAYLKFNNAIKRMSEPREVEQTEADVESVFRNETGCIYAVVYHYKDGSVDSDMLVKKKDGGWSFYRNKVRFHPNFVSTYIWSIYGYKRPSESQIAQELASVPAFPSKMAILEDHVLKMFLGGLVISKYTLGDSEMTSVELIDFVPYEAFERDKIKSFYYDLLHRYVSSGDLNIDNFPEELVKETLEQSLKKMQKKYNK